MADPVYLSINEFPGDGTTTTHEINFAGGYISQSHVKAYIKDAAGLIAPVTVTGVMFEGPNTINLGVAAPVGGLTRIYRETPRGEPLVNFTDGARITEANLDLLAEQTIFAVAEAFDAGAYATVNDILGEAIATYDLVQATLAEVNVAIGIAEASATSATEAAGDAADSAAIAATTGAEAALLAVDPYVPVASAAAVLAGASQVAAEAAETAAEAAQAAAEAARDVILALDPAAKAEIMGPGQTLQTVTRVNGTTYTNTTGKPIIATAYGTTANVGGFMHINLAGSPACIGGFPAAPANIAANVVVPPGITYSYVWAAMGSITIREYRT